MSHAVAEPPHTSAGHHGHSHGHASHGAHSVSRVERMKIFDHLPVVHIPEGFSSPAEIHPDPHAHDHHHHDHSEQDHQIKEILGESPVAAVSNTFEAVIARTAAPIWHMLGKLGIHVY